MVEILMTVYLRQTIMKIVESFIPVQEYSNRLSNRIFTQTLTFFHFE